MPARDQILSALHEPKLSRKYTVLLILALEMDRRLNATDVRRLAVESGVPEARRWNISDILGKAKGLAVRFPDGWGLTSRGEATVHSIIGGEPTSTKPAAAALRKALTKLRDTATVSFLEEAIKCLEHDLHRASVVLSWVGAISVLYDHVVSHKLDDFNTEASKRDPKWRPARTRDDLGRMKESEFLDVLTAISVLGKSTKEHLKSTCLNLRNSCGHPSSLKVGKHTVEAHLEALILNVFGEF